MSNKLSELNANSQVQASDLMYIVQENEDNELEGRKILAKNAIGQEIPYATWQNMTAEQKEEAGKVFVPDFPTATPNATEIPMSSSDNTSVADAVSNSMYHVGDNVRISGIVSAGYITSSAKSLRFYIPLNKPFNQIGVRNISLNDITMAVRMIDGSYLLDNAKLSTISNSVRVYSNGMGLYVQAVVDGPSNFNNIPCVVQIMEYERNIITLA